MKVPRWGTGSPNKKKHRQFQAKKALPNRSIKSAREEISKERHETVGGIAIGMKNSKISTGFGGTHQKGEKNFCRNKATKLSEGLIAEREEREQITSVRKKN